MKFTNKSIFLFLASLVTEKTYAACPFMQRKGDDVMVEDQSHRNLQFYNIRNGDGGIPEGGYDTVKQDIIDTVLTNSQPFFPADFADTVGANYGPLMIRLAWHCSGSYRDSDGRGGCDGGRIRFFPELSWPDNANLNNALQLLKPIKEKYGSSLSWGDLIILAGNAAIESMGGPILGFCGGRMDDADGSNSLILGPNKEQEELSPCLSLNPSQQGLCNRIENSPIGPTVIGNIYVEPDGPKGHEGDPVASAADVRFTFSRMGFNDTETVSLIGGGHAFGKAHGACASPPCEEGTFTSGFEGAWTLRPTTWTNDYFNFLLDLKFTHVESPAGNGQWEPVDGPDIFMLTSDMAMIADKEYYELTKTYADDISVLEHDFMHSWYKLTTGDMGPRARCLGDNVPPAQEFQYPLPEPQSRTSSYVDVRSRIQELIDADESNTEAFVNLAYRCAATFRDTDYKGGCNGARIRFSPEADWDINEGTSEALETLAPVKEMFDDISMSDIIVLAGQTAIEGAGMNKMKFCGGRVDATEGSADYLEPNVYPDPVVSMKDDWTVKGLTMFEGVALAARTALSNQFFVDLLHGTGEGYDPEDLALLDDITLKFIVQQFATNEEVFKNFFANAWTKMMVSDRFDGPVNNACSDVDDQTLA